MASARRSRPAVDPNPSSPASGEFTYDLLLSYNSQDRAIVLKLAGMLREVGLRLWVDQDQILPGEIWIDELESAIKASQAVAVIFGPNGLGPWQSEEMRSALTAAVRKKKRIFPVILESVRGEPDLPSFLALRHAVDLREGGLAEGVEKIRLGALGRKETPSGLSTTSGQPSDENRSSPRGTSDGETKSDPDSAVTFEDLTSGPGELDTDWISQADIDELLLNAPATEQASLRGLLRDLRCPPALPDLVGAIELCFAKSIKWDSVDKRRTFAATAEAAIRACLMARIDCCCSKIPLRSGKPIRTALRTAVLAEILMAGAQKRPPYWEQNSRGISEIVAQELFYDEFDGEPLLDAGPAAEDEIIAVESRLFKKLRGERELYDPSKHRSKLRGKLMASERIKLRFYARIDPARRTVDWQTITKEMPFLTVLEILLENESATYSEEELADLFHRFYGEYAPELLQSRPKEAP